MMVRSSPSETSRWHLLLIACAILGLVVDAPRAPATGLVTPGLTSTDASSSCPPQEDSEEDELPEEASDEPGGPTWTVSEVRERRHARSSRHAILIHSRRERTRPLSQSPAASDLTIRLCRLTC